MRTRVLYAQSLNKRFFLSTMGLEARTGIDNSIILVRILKNEIYFLSVNAVNFSRLSEKK